MTLPTPNRGTRYHHKRDHISWHLPVIPERRATAQFGDVLRPHQQLRRSNSYLLKKFEKKVEKTEFAIATIEMANGIYPHEHFPQIDASNPDKAELYKTLQRITRHLTEDADLYDHIYNHIRDIEHLFSNIEKIKEELQEAIKCVRELVKTPTRPDEVEAVHNALRKVSSAGRTVIFLQKTALELVQAENELLKRDSVAHGRPSKAESVKEEEKSINLLPKSVLQSLREDVRSMVFKEHPIDTIPTYRGKDIDGAAIDFFKRHYAEYIIHGNEVIFAKDLAKIDDRLLRALRNEARSGVPMPLGTASDLSRALVNERFVDGKNTRNRVQNLRWRANPGHISALKL